MQTSVLLILSYFTITKKITVNFGELLLLNKLSQKPQIDRIFSRVLRDSTTRFVCRFIGPSVVPSHFTFLGFLRSLASLLLPK